MIRHAIDHGVNYVDTACPYHKEMSEPLVEQALEDGYRDRMFLATKLPGWLVNNREDMDKILDVQLARLQTDRIDCYLLLGLMQQGCDRIVPLHLTEFLDDSIADGMIRYTGLSFHDTIPLFKEIVDAYDLTFAQIQYNYMDQEYQAGTKGLRYTAGKGPGMVIIETVRGGLLLRKSRAPRMCGKTCLAETPRLTGRSAGSLAVEVTVALSGIFDHGLAEG
ncbi:MAG: aldo/keto reductase, partial [Methanomicrobiales archaeon]